jgi:hypothetical protein
MRLRLIKSRLSKVLCLALGSVAVTAPIIACSNSLSQELYISISGQQFFNEIISNEFIKHYVSDKGNPINYSKENSTDHDMCKKINDLIKPKDMIFLMGYDVAHMFKDDEEKIVEYCRNVVLYVDKFNNQFNVSECWTDKNYAFPAPYSGVTGANCVAHCINDTRIAVSQVGIDTQLGV